MDFDLLVVGGGPVGASLACAAASGGLKAGLVAQERPAADAPAGALDARVYALSPGNVEFLRGIRAWQALDASRVTPVRAMRVFGDADRARIEFDAYEAGVPALAWTVEDAHLQQGLWRALDASPGARSFVPAQSESFASETSLARVKLRDGRALSAQLVAAADGAGSVVREQAGIAVTRREYGQAAVVANFECAKAHDGVARQWFQGGAVLALLPLPGRRVSMIWSLPAEEAARTAALGAGELCAALARASGGALGELGLVTPPRSYPLRRLAARRMIGPRLALLGDAAHVIHPLAGQGLNLGLQDARQLAALLAERRANGDAGDPALLRAYERRRAEPILVMDFTVDGLFRLFSAPGRAARAARNAGLNLADRMQVIKNLLIRQAMA